MDGNEARIIAVANEKGGVGKTVTVINLGAALQQEGRKVLIVDMDPQANATKGFGIEADKDGLTCYDVIMGDPPVPAMDAVLRTDWKGIELLPSNVDLAGAEVELVDVEGRENWLKEAMEDLNGAYDFILLDTPPSLSLLTINVFAYAREVIVPCQTHPYAYAALDELFDTIGAVKRVINPDLSITGILATLFDRRTRVGHRILDQLKSDDRYGEFLLNTVIRSNTTIADSADVGKPVVYFRRSSFGAADYIDLAAELLSQ